jgi:uncharacterized membrane protein
MTDIFNSGYTPLHMLNVFAHVGFGTLAILLGLAQLMIRKGGPAHSWIGRVYLGLFIIVISTALIGSIAFGFRAFLAALTLSAGYWLLSGLRVLNIREGGPRSFDNIAALIFMGLAVALAIYMRGRPEQSTMAAYIALANVVSVCVYDLARNLNARAWLKRSWLNEHIYKMIGSHAALLSAAGGNLFLSLQPWSIFLPTTISLVLIALFVLRHPLKRD